jgi:hypothetical protein
MINATDKALLNKFSPNEGLGDQLFNQCGLLVGSYDFAVQGGATGTIPLLDVNTGKKITLPIGAVITKSWIDVQTPCTTADAGTLALTSGQTAADILVATAAASVTGIMPGVSTGTAATMKKISSSAKTPAAVIANNLTNGKLLVYMEYVLSAV